MADELEGTVESHVNGKSNGKQKKPTLRVVDRTWSHGDQWRTKLLTKLVYRGGVPTEIVTPILSNVVVFLRYHPDWEGVIAWDEFAERIVIARLPTWSEGTAPCSGDIGPWRDNDAGRIVDWLARREGFHVSKALVEMAVPLVADTNVVHPVREYLQGLRWDGQFRLHTLLSAYAGAQDCEYARAMGVRWMISAVARVILPGCQADLTLILEGAQGVGKSQFFRELVPKSEWFSETGIEIGEKDSYQALHGVWIYLLDELDSLRRSEVARTKSFLTATKDHYRPPYGRSARDFPRQNVFAGTTNEGNYLSDSTGNRRFVPVAVTREPDVAALQRDRDQLWAEAYARFTSGETWWVETVELRKLCEGEQEERVQADEWESKIGPWLTPMRQRVSVGDVLELCLGIDAGKWTQADQTRAARCLLKLGLKRRQFRDGERRIWKYERANLPLTETSHPAEG